jgi:hypothetical protein
MRLSLARLPVPVADADAEMHIGNRKWFVYSKLYLVQMRFPLQTNQILQEGFAFRCTVSAFLDLGVRIFLASCIMLRQGRQRISALIKQHNKDEGKIESMAIVYHVPAVRPIRRSAHDKLGDPMVVNQLHETSADIVARDDDLARVHLRKLLKVVRNSDGIGSSRLNPSEEAG